MDSHALTVLEFPVFLAELASHSQTAPGAERLCALAPTPAIEEIVARRRPFQDAMRLFGEGITPPGLLFEDVSDVLRRLTPEGSAVDGEELVRCRALLDCCADAKTFLHSDSCRGLPTFSAWGERLQDAPDVRQALHRALDHDGVVQDSASSRLAELRRRARSLERRLQDSLAEMVNQTAADGVVQDRFVTTRNGRFVIPVKREQRGSVPGVVHDHSNSGQTVFVEPSATLPMGNDLADTRLQERDEVLRILHELSARVRGLIPDLRENVTLLADLDMALAVGRWATRDGCRMPRFGTRLKLVAGRHPLLEKQLRNEGRGGDLVPLNLALSKGTRVLVVTGSNTGGKTVVLKTVGLLTLLAQCGLPVPVGEDTELELFEEVFADIGDEQSLVASLSTFSGHLNQIGRILQGIGRRRTLVLLDELGSGTDPLEGGALACSVLDELAVANALTLATTHLGVVKTFAHEHEHMVNAAVAFDLETLRPEYSLEVGRPGASHALQIARRLGLPKKVMNRAEAFLSSDHLRLEGMLAKIEEDQRRIANQEREVAEAHERMVKDREGLSKELDELKKERRRLMHDAYQQAAGVVENTRRQMDAQLREFRQQLTDQKQSERAATAARERLRQKSESLADGARQTSAKPVQPVRPGRVRVGDMVRVPRLNGQGEVVEILDGGKKVDVIVSGLRFTVNVRELEVAEKAPKTAEKHVKVSRPRVARSAQEIVLVGSRVDEALDKLDIFLSQAMLANMEEVRVVHGFGTGRLRQGIHDWLRQQRAVASFRLGKHEQDPGGAGVTIVTLR
jgi:DNA mismatch repair protein MutS2